ncbi:unnamed protein product [Protopolystoma xenopodis]|uniref:Uncharacterized protein n=1 Tax=Protopolystoma xenopodis TaxID=117903 RepID=A0A3S5CR85_9PLAT|nr:unnamed protein product [Protopolystoma xenopodis]
MPPWHSVSIGGQTNCLSRSRFSPAFSSVGKEPLGCSSASPDAKAVSSPAPNTSTYFSFDYGGLTNWSDQCVALLQAESENETKRAGAPIGGGEGAGNRSENEKGLGPEVNLPFEYYRQSAEQSNSMGPGPNRSGQVPNCRTQMGEDAKPSAYELGGVGDKHPVRSGYEWVQEVSGKTYKMHEAKGLIETKLDRFCMHKGQKQMWMYNTIEYSLKSKYGCRLYLHPLAEWKFRFTWCKFASRPDC